MTFYFYDLETGGFSPKEARIMQFAGQRTDMHLKPIGSPHNYLIKMTDDTVPDPDAVLITGITPQKTISDGITEAEFLKIFYSEVAQPDTIFIGFNNVRFDDEFMRFLLYRNFYDAYEWQWQDGRSRWDLLDVTRMTRALRPDGIKWPFDSSGKPSNRLGLLTSLNGIEHIGAHDALSDVNATIDLARLIQKSQPKLFEYLLSLRNKKQINELVHAGEPFVYTSGKYSSDFEKTTVVGLLAEHPKRGALVFDLRYDPTDFAKLSPSELATAWTRRWDEPGIRLPVKTLQFNRCPSVAPLSVLDSASQKRLQLSLSKIKSNFEKLQTSNLKAPVLAALETLEEKRQATLMVDSNDVDVRLYEGFVSGQDKTIMSLVRAAKPEEISIVADKFKDERLKSLLPLYKARNYPKHLSEEERIVWEQFRGHRLTGGKTTSRLANYFKRLEELASKSGLTGEEKYLIEELQLYGQSVMPESGLE